MERWETADACWWARSSPIISCFGAERIAAGEDNRALGLELPALIGTEIIGEVPPQK